MRLRLKKYDPQSSTFEDSALFDHLSSLMGKQFNLSYLKKMRPWFNNKGEMTPKTAVFFIREIGAYHRAIHKKYRGEFWALVHLLTCAVHIKSNIIWE